MIVFKFGGASVKDAGAVKNVGTIIQKYPEKMVVVISAMGKTTNLLETLVKAYFNREEKKTEIFGQFKKYHTDITNALFNGAALPVYIENIYRALEDKISSEPSEDYNFEYDQIIVFGELLSTAIVSYYLNSVGIEAKWMDIRPILKTDNSYREGVVDWETTSVNVKRVFNFSDTNIYLTQGFIGSDPQGFSVSLGREGSDYTAAILGNILDAQYVAIWKDVPGVLNADPKQIEATEMLPELSYREAIEMSHSGAQVIHPKTMKPLHNKNIPLFVKSFLNPESEGTVIRKIDHKLELAPVYIIKENQVLITLSPNDFSFIGVKDISFVFELLARNRFKINLFQQSAIDLNLVADFPETGFDKTIAELANYYEIKYNTSLRLVTIRYYTDEAIKNITRGCRVYIEQKSRRTARLVTSTPEKN